MRCVGHVKSAALPALSFSLETKSLFRSCFCTSIKGHDGGRGAVGIVSGTKLFGAIGKLFCTVTMHRIIARFAWTVTIISAYAELIGAIGQPIYGLMIVEGLCVPKLLNSVCFHNVPSALISRMLGVGCSCKIQLVSSVLCCEVRCIDKPCNIYGMFNRGFSFCVGNTLFSSNELPDTVLIFVSSEKVVVCP